MPGMAAAMPPIPVHINMPKTAQADTKPTNIKATDSATPIAGP
ncbi:hypothetical protein MKFW12EY_10660 [Methylomonas koyamae]|nr:hypothetical protein MKFW12EY_10660 [Methylomonas koyamae]